MKIEQQLMTVIRAAAKYQKRPDNSWSARRDRQRKAILELRQKKPELDKALASMADAEASLLLARHKGRRILAKYGLGSEGNDVDDEALFNKKGGKLEIRLPEWTAEEVFIKLAGAKDQKAFDAILKTYGIEWKP